MSENETEQTKTEPTPDPVAATKKESPLKMYLLAVVIVLVVLMGVLYKLEKEGRSSTNIYGSIIASQEANSVVATVNGEDIINKELQTSIEQFSQMALAQGVDTNNPDTQLEIRDQALEVLINTNLLIQEAGNRGLSISEEEVNSRLENIRIELGGDEVLTERMESLGISPEKLQEDIGEELLIQSLLDQVFAEANIEVTEEEILAIYAGAGGETAGLPGLEEVREQVQAQIVSSKEQAALDQFIVDLKEAADIEIVE